jgi:anthranilate phosphoribosyltransferase
LSRPSFDPMSSVDNKRKQNSIDNNKRNLLRQIFVKLSKRENLGMNEAEAAAGLILNGLVGNQPGTNELLIAFFGGLTIKEPTVEELAGMAAAMETTKKFRFRFNVNGPLVTAGGTGGDTVPTINVTTPAVIIAASAGSCALKSGARAFSSKTGSSDLADALGINISASREVVEDCVRRIGVTVWASEGVYPWMRPLIELGSRESITVIMPYLYSLRLMIATALNPFSIKRQVRGVSGPFTEKVARVLARCGYEKALVVLGYGNTEEVRIDEYSNLGKTIVSELKLNGSIETYSVYPEEIGVKRGRIDEVKARPSHLENAEVAIGVLSGLDKSSNRDLILLNAASILYVADQVRNIKDGYELACQSVDEGKAIEKLKQLITLSAGRMESLESIMKSVDQHHWR